MEYRKWGEEKNTKIYNAFEMPFENEVEIR